MRTPRSARTPGPPPVIRIWLVALLFANAAGCCSLCRRSTWTPPVTLNASEARCGVSSQQLALASAAYTTGLTLEQANQATSVDAFFQAAMLSWDELEPRLDDRVAFHSRASLLYHSALIKLVQSGQRFGRLDPARGLTVRQSGDMMLVPTTYRGFSWQSADFDRLIPVGDYASKDLRRSYRNGGLGVATVAVHERRAGQQFQFSRQVLGATVVLRRRSPGTTQLHDPTSSRDEIHTDPSPAAPAEFGFGPRTVTIAFRPDAEVADGVMLTSTDPAAEFSQAKQSLPDQPVATGDDASDVAIGGPEVLPPGTLPEGPEILPEPDPLFSESIGDIDVPVELISPAAAAAGDCPFVLELFEPTRNWTADVDGRTIPLRRDTTAPVAYVLKDAGNQYLTAFLQPGANTEQTGLFTLEPYQRGKIPLVLVHGLLSDRFTWSNLANELYAIPELRDRYQIWGFEYPTGQPFLESAALLRQQLNQAQTYFDPHGTDPALAQTIVMGHSMGGLVTRLLVSESGDRIWSAVANRPFDQIVVTPNGRERLANAFFFAPVPMVSRVVFIGTPHEGSPWARRPIGCAASLLVREPLPRREQHQQLIEDNPGVFTREFTKRIPTSIDLLKPSSPMLEAIGELPISPAVQMHSVIGCGYWLLCGGNSDEVVPVESASIAGVETEKKLKAKHVRIHHEQAGLDELLCILRKHLEELELPAEVTWRPIRASDNITIRL